MSKKQSTEGGYNGFTLVNKEKLNRAIFGSMSREGSLSGGVGEDASPEAVLAAYDRLGGLVLKGTYKVKMGSFYDFKAKKPRAEAEVVFVFRNLAGDEVEVAEGEEVPIDVQAAQMKPGKKGAKGKKDKDEEEVPADEQPE